MPSSQGTRVYATGAPQLVAIIPCMLYALLVHKSHDEPTQGFQYSQSAQRASLASHSSLCLTLCLTMLGLGQRLMRVALPMG